MCFQNNKFDDTDTSVEKSYKNGIQDFEIPQFLWKMSDLIHKQCLNQGEKKHKATT
jgi:hypothetical protein